MSMKPMAIGALAAAILFLPATAVAFSGPWDSAHQPAAVSSPGILVTVDQTIQAFQVQISPSVSCPGGSPVPLSVTFADPSYAVTDTLSNPCAQTWTAQPISGAGDFVTGPAPGDPSGLQLLDPTELNPSDAEFWASDSFDPLWGSGKEPFLYTVTGPSGPLAQGAYTASADDGITQTIIDERHHIDAFINTCIDGGYTLYSMNGGDLYCVVTSGSDTTTYTPGWPPPAVPKPYVVSRAAALADARAALKHLSAKPQQVKLTSCSPLSLTRWRCNASWRDQHYAYSGTLTVWDPSQANKYFYFGFKGRKTALNCARRCTGRITIA
jgi:hypothetical protein